MKNKEKYNLRELEYVVRYAPYWNLYTIEVRKRKPDDSDNLNDGELYATIKTKKPELEAVMDWLESEYSENEKH